MATGDGLLRERTDTGGQVPVMAQVYWPGLVEALCDYVEQAGCGLTPGSFSLYQAAQLEAAARTIRVMVSRQSESPS